MRKRLLTLLICGAVAATAVLAGAAGVGKTGANFTLKDVNGNTHSLASKKGQSKAIAVIFVNHNCPVSRPYSERIKAFHEKYRDRGVTVFAIDSINGNPAGDVKRFYDQAGWGLPVLKDPDKKIADAYGATKTPTVYIMDTNLVVRYSGSFDNSDDASKVTADKRYADRAMTAILAGQKPPVEETRAFGCEIR